jgi:hypothetical protein
MNLERESKLLDEKLDLKPYWEADEAPSFLSRTKKEYIRIPMKDFEYRGMKNPILTNITSVLPKDAYIVGGYALSFFKGDDKAHDIDIAFTNAKSFIKTYNLIIGAYETPENLDSEDDRLIAFRGYKLDEKFSTDYITTNGKELRFVKFVHPVKPPIQLLKMAWYESPEHIIDTFDLTVAQFAVDNSFLYTNPMSITDVTRKRIVLHRMQFPASTIRRVIKYVQKGYYACPGALVEIAEAIKDHEGDTDVDYMQFVYID